MASVSPPISPAAKSPVEARSVSPTGRGRYSASPTRPQGKLWRVNRLQAGRPRSASPVVASRRVDEAMCPNCSNLYVDDAMFCRKCGTKRVQVQRKEDTEVTCQTCSNVYMADATFCRKCGSKRPETPAEKQEKEERKKSEEVKFIYEGVVKVENDNGGEEARYAVLNFDSLKLYINKESYKMCPNMDPPPKKGAGVFPMSDLLGHIVMGNLIIRLTFRTVIVKIAVPDKSMRSWLCELISQCKNMHVKSRPASLEAEHKDAVTWLAQTLQWEPDDRPALRMPWSRQEQEELLLYSRIASRGKEPITHGGLGVDHGGKMNVRFAALFPDCLDVWERPKDAAAGKKPFLHIPLTEVRSVVACGSGFVLSFKGRKIGFHMSRDEDMTKWTRSMLDVLGTVGSPEGAQGGRRFRKSVHYWDC